MNLTTKNEIRVVLTNAGLWLAFHRTREIYKAEQMSAPAAYQRCFEEFFPGGLGTEPVMPEACMIPRTAEDSRNPKTKSSMKPVEENGSAGTVPDMKPSAIGVLPDGALEGKTASRAEIVDWVAKNIAIPHPKWDTCPSPEAWALLSWVRQPGGLNESDFWKSLYRALLPSRTELEATARFSDNGQNVLRVIAQLEKVSATQED